LREKLERLHETHSWGVDFLAGVDAQDTGSAGVFSSLTTNNAPLNETLTMVLANEFKQVTETVEIE
jgi:hypothetical protein